MIRWIVYAVVSLGWIATCYFFGSMVGGTEAGVPAGRVQDACAARLMAAGRAADRTAARSDPECRTAHLDALQALSAPYVRKGLLWGVLPVVFVGGVMLLRQRSDARG